MTAIEMGEHADLVTAIGQLHAAGGNDPADMPGSLLVVPLTDTMIIGTVQYELPDPPDPDMTVALAKEVMEGLKSPPDGWEKPTMVVVAGYGPAELADPLLDMLTVVLHTIGLPVYDILRVHDGHCWSYLCPGEEHDRDGPGILVDPWSDRAIEVATEIGRKR